MNHPSRSMGLNPILDRWLQRNNATILFERDSERPEEVVCYIDCAAYGTRGRGASPYDAYMDAVAQAQKDGIEL